MCFGLHFILGVHLGKSKMICSNKSPGTDIKLTSEDLAGFLTVCWKKKTQQLYYTVPLANILDFICHEDFLKIIFKAV